jgi:hypothetical protein
MFMSPKWSLLQLSQLKFCIHVWPHAPCPSLIWLPFTKSTYYKASHYANFPVPAFFCHRSEYFPHYPVLPLQWKPKFCIHIKRGGTKIVYRLIFMFIINKWEDNYDLNNHNHSTNIICFRLLCEWNFDLLPSFPNIWILSQFQRNWTIRYICILHYNSIHYSKMSTKFSILEGTMDY